MDLRPSPTISASLPFWRQLRWHLIASYVVLAIVPVILIQTLTINRTRDELQTHVFEKLESIADIKRDQIETWIKDSAISLQLFLSEPVSSQLLQFAQAPDEAQQERINQLLKQATSTETEQSIHFQEVFLYLPDGRIIAASDESLLGRIVNRQPYFNASLEGNYVQSPYYSPSSNELQMILTQPLYNAQQQLIAVVGVQLDLSILGEIMLSRSGLGETGETYLVSLESRYLLTPSRFEGYPLTRAYHSEGINKALQGLNGSNIYTNYRIPGESVMGVYRWIPEMQAGLLAEIEVAEAQASINEIQQNNQLLLIMISLIALSIGLSIAAYLTRPILALTQTASRISQGDFSQRAEVLTRNEIGVLAEGFNTMLARLEQNMQELEQRVTERTAELQQALDERNTTLNELRASIDARETLEQTIQELSSPVLPVLEGVIVMPLIGAIDSTRAELLINSFMQAIEQHRANVAIIDVTGVPMIDTQIARVLVSAAEAAKLLGAKPILVGIRPELAQVIVGLGLDLSGLTTQADLASGVRYAATHSRQLHLKS